MRDTLYRERQQWSGNESVKIRYVSDSFVAGTSALSPGITLHMQRRKRGHMDMGGTPVSLEIIRTTAYTGSFTTTKPTDSRVVGM